ncbi:MAG: hypothetical protein PHE96_00275 [Methylococcales bacterium]|nr:hypothetical protein [Methylococcales bacterium]
MTVVNFPKAKKTARRPAILDVTKQALHSDTAETVRYRVFPWLGRALVNTVMFAWSAVRTLMLMVLMFLRPLVFFVITPLTTALMIAFAVCLFTHPADTRLTWGFGLLTLGAFFTMFMYDWLIFKLGGMVVEVTHHRRY